MFSAGLCLRILLIIRVRGRMVPFIPKMDTEEDFDQDKFAIRVYGTLGF